MLYTLVETKPEFTTLLKDVTVPEEQSVTLECELSKPDQKVKWLKNGKEIKPDRKREIHPKVEGTKHSLTIPKTEKDDTAEYSVKIGDEETKGKLTVEGRLRSKVKYDSHSYDVTYFKCLLYINLVV